MEKALITQIKKLPNTQVQESPAPGGLGSIRIYETLPNGVRSISVWLGRPFTVQRLQNYIANRASLNRRAPA